MRGVVPRSRSKSTQTSGAASCPPVVRGRHAQRGKVGGPRTIRAVAPRHAAPGAGRQGGGDRPHGFGTGAVGQLQAGRRAPRPSGRGGTAVAGVPRNTVSVDEMPSAYGSFSRCRVRRRVALSPNSASPSTAVTSNPAARICRSSVSARRHFSWKRTVAGIRRADGPPASATPRAHTRLHPASTRARPSRARR